MYWCISATIQLLISLIVQNKKFRNLMGIPKNLPGTILEKIVINV